MMQQQVYKSRPTTNKRGKYQWLLLTFSMRFAPALMEWQVLRAAPKGDISLSYSLHRTHLILVCKEHAGQGVFPTPVILRGEDTMKIVKPGHVEACETARLQSRLMMHGFDPPGTCT